MDTLQESKNDFSQLDTKGIMTDCMVSEFKGMSDFMFLTDTLVIWKLMVEPPASTLC
jgi:hypothetical protein